MAAHAERSTGTGFDSRETKPHAKAGVKRKRAAKSRAASAAGVPRGADE